MNKKFSSIQQENSLDKNYYSKQISNCDQMLTFGKKFKSFLKIDKKIHMFNKKDLKNILNKNSKSIEDDFKFAKTKMNILNKNSNIKSFSPLNEFARKKRISYLPQISPYILSNKSSILIDYNKASEMGSEGFKDFCNNENKNIKEILFAYNDHNFKSMKSYFI